MKPKYNRAFQYIAIPFIGLGMQLYYGYTIKGRENIPQGGCVVCPNHTSLSDPPLAAVALSHKVPLRVMAKKELFEGNRFFAHLISWLGAFPIDRNGTDITAIKTALQAVKDGQKLILFPQGTRGAAEGETKSGAAMIAVKTKAPILPMYITEKKSRRCKLEIIIGKPYYPEQGNKDYDAIAEDILHRIYVLHDEETK